jgi:hypothetical protein
MSTYDEELRDLKERYEFLAELHDLLLRRYIALVKACKAVVLAKSWTEQQIAIDDLRQVLYGFCRESINERGDDEDEQR